MKKNKMNNPPYSYQERVNDNSTGSVIEEVEECGNSTFELHSPQKLEAYSSNMKINLKRQDSSESNFSILGKYKVGDLMILTI